MSGKVEKISLEELRAATQSMKSSENNYLEEQKRLDEDRKLKKQQKEQEAQQQRHQENEQKYEQEVNDIFDELFKLSSEDRKDFFKLVEENVKKD